MLDILQFFAGEMVQASLTTHMNGSYVGGEWTPVDVEPIPIIIVEPQPVTAKELVQLADGEHIKNYRKTWTTNTLVDTRDAGVDADIITYKGVQFKVVEVEDRIFQGSFVRLVMRRVG